MKIETLCPVSDQMVNKWIPRSNAVITTLLLLVYFYTQSYYIIFFLAVDFAFRGFGRPEYSPVAWISRKIVGLLPLSAEKENAGPKFFAARIGWLFSVLILIFISTNLYITANLFAGILSLFAFLEASFGFCMACYIYPHALRLGGFGKKNGFYRKI